MSLTKTLLHGSGSAFAVKIASAGIAFVLQVMLARLMGVTSYGVFVYALSWQNILALLVVLGIDNAYVRFVPSFIAHQDWKSLRGLTRAGDSVVLAASFLVGACALSITWLAVEPGDLRDTLVLTFLALPMLAILQLRYGLLRAVLKVVRAELPGNIIRPLVLAACAFFFWWQGRFPESAQPVMAWNLLAIGVALVFAALWGYRAVPSDARSAIPSYRMGEWLQVALPLLLISGMQLILNRMDIIMLGAMRDTTEAGIYGVTSRIVELVVFALVAVDTVMGPMIAKLYHSRQQGQLQSLVTQAARIVFVITTAVAAILFYWGEDLLGLFGAAFVTGYSVMLILLAGQLVKGVSGSVGWLLTMTGHQRHAVVILVVATLVNLAGNALLIPVWGMQGAAFATTLSASVWTIWMMGVSRRRVGIRSTIW